MSKTTEGIILAAGQGTRMNSNKPKVCHRCFGEPMITHIVRSLNRASMSSIMAVVGEGREEVETILPESVGTVLQENQLGTGHALRQVIDERTIDSGTPLLVTCGDIPGVRPETYETLSETYHNTDSELVLLTTTLDDPAGYGRIKLDDSGRVTSIVEEVDASEQEKRIDLINTGIMCGSIDVFQEYLPKLQSDNEAGEYYLTDVVELMNDEGRRVDQVEVDDSWEVTGINTRRQLVDFERKGYTRRAERSLAKGVTLHDPESVKIGPWVDIARDVEVEGSAFLYGDSRLESGVRIFGQTRIVDSVLGEGTVVDSSTVKSSSLGQDVSIGPNAHLRPGAKISNDAKVGNFVEIKNSTVGEGSKVSHLSYIGDAEIGRNVNVGAGTITCNYDGTQKHRTIVEDDVFIGSNVEIVAPARIGEGATLGAGSTITKDVPAGSLGVGRERQDIIENWNRSDES
ncbi:MAG: bifunctional UDP-N-acetylglucosamine diphosphorylase/glucosamine-1-phosphate N-acetyltransferase GlmU [bacterium]